VYVCIDERTKRRIILDLKNGTTYSVVLVTIFDYLKTIKYEIVKKLKGRKIFKN